MAFSFMGVLAVAFEVFRPLLPFLAAIVVVDLLLFGLSLRKRHAIHNGRPGRLALALGAVGMIAAFFTLPGFTNSELAQLSGVLDYLALTGAALAAGVAVAVLTYPPLRLILR